DLANNTYVDNVIPTATSVHEAFKKYRKSEQIFCDLTMNLREFVTNNQQVMEQIPQEELLRNSTQKISGIKWD
ncbi:hypothetical protein Angca_002124, partial [Angiostrongylus cantonensis]